MCKKFILSLIFFGFTLVNSAFAFEKEVAITVDDLPFVGFAGNDPKILKREEEQIWNIFQALLDNNIPATGFVIAGNIENGQWELLERFQQAGFIIGNHTYDHANLNAMNYKKYIANVDKADKILSSLMSSPKYFRYPFLAEGRGEKRTLVQDYLTSNNYVVAPVTIDSKDFVFNAKLYTMSSKVRARNLDRIKQQYLSYLNSQIQKADRIAKHKNRPVKEILLIHSNLLNSYCMRDVIALFKKNGYHFISLPEALQQSTDSTIGASAANNSIAESSLASGGVESITDNTESAVSEEQQLDKWMF
ncbi:MULTISPECIES: polysaccharide deacetylase family protein [Legionella]|uniref:Polysaccharide deacetylase n=1 Tax=Legionella drozanskii LLAP-1 TaxID=1212489 RepID=A0A0W0TBU4_9GAMM|nr:MULTISPECIES: polysaccharide deacetylase family protein [Legionella]KTC93033.1 polysaccharide deacetylase [Legionella drozanskii LLAP-1]PJE11938.1 MAG: polysaccharide deacetylase [Legionella sp.]